MTVAKPLIWIYRSKHMPPPLRWPAGCDVRLFEAEAWHRGMIDRNLLSVAPLIFLSQDIGVDWITHFAQILRDDGIETPLCAIGTDLPPCPAIDQCIDWHSSPDDLSALLLRWDDDAVIDGFDRLCGAWGEDVLREIADGFIDRLKALLADPEKPVAEERHQLAGVAGTMGFARLSRAAGDESDGAVRVEARRALAALTRRRAQFGS